MQSEPCQLWADRLEHAAKCGPAHWETAQGLYQGGEGMKLLCIEAWDELEERVQVGPRPVVVDVADTCGRGRRGVSSRGDEPKPLEN